MTADEIANWKCPRCGGGHSAAEAGVGARALVCHCSEYERPETFSRRDFDLDDVLDSQPMKDIRAKYRKRGE